MTQQPATGRLGFDGSDFMEISSEKFRALDEIGSIQLLVRRTEKVDIKDFIELKVQPNFNSLSAVISPSHWQQEHVYTERFGKGKSHWD